MTQILAIWNFISANWVTIIAGMVALDRLLQVIGTITGNQALDNIAVTLANWIVKIPANPPKV